jgi:hypothetical protein
MTFLALKARRYSTIFEPIKPAPPVTKKVNPEISSL